MIPKAVSWQRTSRQLKDILPQKMSLLGALPIFLGLLASAHCQVDLSSTAAIVIGGTADDDGEIGLNTVEIFGCPGDQDSYSLPAYPS